MRSGPVDAALVLALLTAACGAPSKAPKPQPVPEVGVVTVSAHDAPLEIELAGRAAASEISEVRPEVNGLIKARRFVEGAIVQQGQTLYEIDPSLYQAGVSQAQANLANAQAAYAAAEAHAERYRPLVDQDIVSKQAYADVLATAKEAAAQIGVQQAAVESARINLRFTRVSAPIGGRIGRSLVTTGALVTAAQTDPLTTIEKLNPIYVDIQQSSTEMTALRRAVAAGGERPSSAAVRLTLEDGSDYPLPGRLEFAEAIVDPATGSVTLRAEFPNPQGLLLPGMFVRARLTQAVAHNAILAPQAAVSRDPRGNATVYVVGPNGRATLRPVTADRTVGADWLVTAGLSPGERVVTEGLNRIKPGQAVRAVAAGSPPARRSA